MPQAIKTAHHNCWAHALESESRDYWSLHALEPVAPQQEKPPNEKPMHGSERVALDLRNLGKDHAAVKNQHS